MIARRMAPIGWVAGVAGAALSFYLVSLQVAAERTALESVERKIAVTQRQIRHLETEFSARASLRQLEAYNQEVLALAAPKVDQYLTNEVQLASYVPGEGLPKPEATTALASAQVAPAAPARPSFKPAVVTDAKSDNAPVVPAVRKQAPLIQTVAMISPVDAPKLAPVKLKPAAKALEKVALLDEASLDEIARKAAKEGKAKTQ
jgi:hypothetical protein